MSEKGAEGILRQRAEEKARADAAARPTYVIEAPSPAESGDQGPSRASRGFGKVHDFQRGANVRTGLNDPRLATWLYLALVATAVMFSKAWGGVVTAVASGTKKK